MRIRRGGPWGFPDTLVGAGMYGLVVVYSISSDGHSGGSSIAVMRQFHEESGVAWCVTASMGIFGG